MGTFDARSDHPRVTASIAVHPGEAGGVDAVLPPELSVIIPAFNEENGIRTTVDRVQAVLDDMPCRSELVVVDDGSSDRTGAEARMATADMAAGSRPLLSAGITWITNLMVFLAGHALNAATYRWLLQDPQATLGLCLRAPFAGLVANLGLPGVVGGDVVGATYLLPRGVPRSAARNGR